MRLRAYELVLTFGALRRVQSCQAAILKTCSLEARADIAAVLQDYTPGFSFFNSGYVFEGSF